MWGELNPLWAFRCRPADFAGSYRRLCLGPFWLSGITTLFFLHLLGFIAVLAFSRRPERPDALLLAAPVALTWAWFGVADVVFRLRRPTRQEREGFDDAVVNWFGVVSIAAAPVMIVALVFVIAIGN